MHWWKIPNSHLKMNTILIKKSKEMGMVMYWVTFQPMQH